MLLAYYFLIGRSCWNVALFFDIVFEICFPSNRFLVIRGFSCHHQKFFLVLCGLCDFRLGCVLINRIQFCFGFESGHFWLGLTLGSFELVSQRKKILEEEMAGLG